MANEIHILVDTRYEGLDEDVIRRDLLRLEQLSDTATDRVAQSFDQLSSRVRESFSRIPQATENVTRSTREISRAADKAADDTKRAFDRAGQAVEQSFDGVEGEVKQIGEAADEIPKRFRQAGGQAAESFADELAGIDLGDMASSLLGQLRNLGAAAGPIAAVATLAAAAYGEQFNQEIASRLGGSSRALGNAIRLGLPRSEAQALGTEAAEAYRVGFGESMEALQRDISDVFSIIESNVAGTTGKTLAKELAQLSEVFGVAGADTAEAFNVALTTGLAGTGREAVDLITVALQDAGPRADEVLDIIREYGPAFADAGFTGSQALASINAALELGALQGDRYADSVKELNLGLATVEGQAAALALGLDPRRLTGGGPEAYGAVIQALNDMGDATEAATIESDLFGTTLEDVDLDNLEAKLRNSIDGYRGYQDAAREVIDAQSELNEKTTLLGIEVASLDDIMSGNIGFERYINDIRESESSTLDAAESMSEFERRLGFTNTATRDLTSGFEAATGAVADLSAEFDRLDARFAGAQGMRGILDLGDRMVNTLTGLEGSLFTVNGEFDRSNETARQFEAQLERMAGEVVDLAQAYDSGTISGREFTDAHNAAAAQLRRAGEAAGLTTAEVDALIATYLAVPDSVETEARLDADPAKRRLAELNTNLDQYDVRTPTASARVNPHSANSTIGALNARLDGLSRRQARPSVVLVDRASAPAVNIRRAIDQIRSKTVTITTKHRNIGGGGTGTFRQSGGLATGLTMVGEEGPELIDLGAEGARVFSAGQTRSGLTRTGGPGDGRAGLGARNLNGSGGVTVVLNVQGSVVSDRDLTAVILDAARSGAFNGIFDQEAA